MTEAKDRLIDFGRASWEAFINEWVRGALAVPLMPCTVDQLFLLYRRWSEAGREHVTTRQKFSGYLAAHEALTRRRDVHYVNGKARGKVTMIVPKAPVEEYRHRENEPQELWFGRCIGSFETLYLPIEGVK
jgi:hypothetical protein